MDYLVRMIRSNWPLLVAGTGGLVLTALAFAVLMGLNAVIGVALFSLVVVVSLGVYRLISRGPVAWHRPLAAGRIGISTVIGVLVISATAQAVPYGWDRSNPPVTAEPAWDSPRTRELAARACFDCHSNEVDYPWYAHVAPMSWAVQRHVDAGRDRVNFSEFDKPQRDAEESAETVREGSMPPSYFTLLAHPEARLNDSEKQELINGLVATFGDEDRGEDRDDD